MLSMCPREAKVDKLDSGTFVTRFKENILWLDVAVYDILAVEMLHGLKERFDDLDSLSFRQASSIGRVIHNLVEEFSTGVPLGDDVYKIIIFVTVDHLHNT